MSVGGKYWGIVGQRNGGYNNYYNNGDEEDRIALLLGRMLDEIDGDVMNGRTRIMWEVNTCWQRRNLLGYNIGWYM